jgi:hypothetical protein
VKRHTLCEKNAKKTVKNILSIPLFSFKAKIKEPLLEKKLQINIKLNSVLSLFFY